MSDNLWIYVVTFVTALITLLTGFGVGSILTPTFTIIYDIKMAVFLVAIIHFTNNLFKFALFYQNVDIAIIKRFGLVSIIGAVAGSFLQDFIGGKFLKSLLGAVLVYLGLAEIFSNRISFRFDKKNDIFGGFLSGLLGGLVGNQGAIRSAYLLNYQVSKETFIATGTLIALIIDATRIPIYLYSLNPLQSAISWSMFFLVLTAFAGTFIGKQFLKKVSHDLFRKLVAMLIIVMGVVFIFGIF